MKRTFLFAFFTCCAFAVTAQQILVEISSGTHARKGAPVQVKLTQPLAAGNYQLTNRKTGKVLPAQLADSVTLVFIPEAQMPANSTNAYILNPAAKKFNTNIKVQHQANGLLVTVQHKPLFFYHTKEMMPPADSPAYYRRSGFIHPLFSPNGSVLTDDFPADHAHQHGIFMTWVNTTFRGQFLDFWNQHKKTGTVAHVEVISVTEGPVFTQIKTKLHHVSLTEGPVLEEVWTITVYPFSKDFLFDLESKQVNITKDTLYLNKYTYGGLAFRGSKQWNKHDKAHYKNNWQILTSEGKDTSNANHTHARWTDASGKIDNKISGATVFGHPGNFRYPQSIRVHPDMPYWCFAPVVDAPFTLAPGKPYTSRFRYFVHAGVADRAIIENINTDFVEPVGANIKY